MHYVTHRSHRIQKHKFGVMCPGRLFVESVPVPPEQKKIARRCFTSRMHRNALRVPQIPLDAKHKFGVMCTVALFVKSVPVPPDYEN
jgi:hypothetical protein